MEMESDEWDFSAEEFETLERDALNLIAQRKTTTAATTSSSSTGTATHPPSNSYNNNSQSQSQSTPSSSSANPVFDDRKFNSLPTAAGNPPVDTTRNLSGDDCSKSRPKLSIKFFLHASGNIAAKFVYNEVLVGALRKVPKATWNAKERLWIFPLSSLSSAEKIVGELTGSNIEIETLDPSLQRAIAAASAVPDLREGPTPTKGSSSFHLIF